MAENRLYQGPIYVKNSPIHGYGVFAAKALAKNELVEKCPIVIYIGDESDSLGDYTFSIRGKRGLPFGFGCLYNHSDHPNVEYNYHPEQNLLVFTTLRPIQAGEELFSSYGPDWFSSRELRPKAPFFYYWRKLIFRGTLVFMSYYLFLEGLRYLSS